MRKPTKKDLNLFKKECDKWIDKLGLRGIRIDYLWSNTRDAIALVDRDGIIPHHVVNVVFTKNCWIDNNIIKDSAKHEAIHVLLSRFATLAYDRHSSSENILEAEEEVVRILCGVIHR